MPNKVPQIILTCAQNLLPASPQKQQQQAVKLNYTEKLLSMSKKNNKFFLSLLAGDAENISEDFADKFGSINLQKYEQIIKLDAAYEIYLQIQQVFMRVFKQNMILD